VTTAMDPNPETFKNIFTPPFELQPENQLEEFNDEVDDARSNGTGSTASVQYDLPQVPWAREDTEKHPALPASVMLQPSPGNEDETRSVDTVCKDYQQYACSSRLNPSEPPSFARFLLDCGVNIVIRANFPHEKGMITPSYDAKTLRGMGIHHCEVPFVDKEGALPRNTDAAKVVRMCHKDVGQDGAVLIHCKGGFGRSMVLACMVVMCRYDVPGRALLGWVRMARPGSINTPEQEQFLCSLEGRNDVLGFAGLPSDFQTLDAASSGQPYCSIQ